MRLYRAASGLLPRGFPDDYGAGMEAMFRDEWRARTRVGRVVLVGRAAADLVWTAITVRVLGTHGTRLEGGTTMTMWTGWGMDLRTSLRALARAPLFTGSAALSLALGFGGVATVYALADQMLLDPIEGVRDADALVELTPAGLPYPVVQDYQRAMRTLSGVAAHRARTAALELGPGADPRPVPVGVVSANYFDVLGVSPERGRLLTPSDSLQGAPLVAVLSHAIWTELGRRDDVIGTDVRINGAAFRVVGVAPAGFSGLRLWTHPAVFIPVEGWNAASLGRTPTVDRRGWGWMAAVARLAPGASVAAAVEEVRDVAEQIVTAHPENEADLAQVGVVPARLRAADEAGGALPPLLLALGGMALLALLAAAANVANLLLSRATRRARELSVRAALGAGRARLARLAMVEYGLLVALGAALGLGLSVVALRALGAMPLPGGIRIDVAGFRPDPFYLTAACLLLLLVVAVAGIAPALASGRVSSSLAMSDRSGGGGPRGGRLRAGLAALQVGVSVVLLAGTLLFGQSIVRALGVDLRFTPEQLAVVRIDASLFRDDRAAASSAVSRLLEQIREQPGVDAASWSTVAPLTQDRETETFDIVGRAWPDRRPSVEINAVGGDFFEASGIPLVSGNAEAVAGPVRTPTVVVTESMARRYWPDESPVGATLAIMARSSRWRPWRPTRASTDSAVTPGRWSSACSPPCPRLR